MLSCCNRISGPDGSLILGHAARQRVAQFFERKSTEGYRVLGVATKLLDSKTHYNVADEMDMTFEGFLLFYDPLKEDVQANLRQLTDLGIETKIISDDNRFVAAHVGAAVGLGPSRLLTGGELHTTRDEALWHLAEETQIFAEIDPQQKERIVRALQKRGHAFAYLGDGINDAPRAACCRCWHFGRPGRGCCA